MVSFGNLNFTTGHFYDLKTVKQKALETDFGHFLINKTTTTKFLFLTNLPFQNDVLKFLEEENVVKKLIIENFEVGIRKTKIYNKKYYSQ